MSKTGMRIQKFGYNTAALTEYIEQNEQPLIHRATFSGKTASIFPVQTGIKYKEAINIQNQQAIFISDVTCGFTPSGATTLSQRIITVAPFRMDEQYCDKDLEKFWAQKMLSAGGTYESLAFEQDWSAFKADLIGEQIEQMLWRSNIAAPPGQNFQFFDGFIKVLDDSGATINGNPGNINTATGITTANVQGIFDDIFRLIPETLIGKPNVKIFAGWDVFRTLVVSLKNQNFFHYNGVVSNPYEAGEITLPGSGYTVMALHGLTGTNRIFAGQVENFMIGTDLEHEEEKFRIWYSQDDDIMKFQTRLKLGTQVAFPNEVVSFKLV